MALKAIVTKEEHAKLPKELAEHYSDSNGRLVLSVESVEGYALEPVADLKSALSTEKENAKRYFRDLEKFKDLDPEKARDALAKLEKLGKGSKDEDFKAALEAQVAQVTAKFEPEIKQRDERIGLLKGALDRALVDSELARIIGGGNGEKAAGSVDLLIPVLRPNIRVEEDGGRFVTRVVDEKGTPLITRKSGSQEPMGLEEYVLGTRNDRRYAGAWNGSGASGSGATGLGQASNGASRFSMTEEQAKDPRAFQAAWAEAQKAGQQLTVTAP